MMRRLNRAHAWLYRRCRGRLGVRMGGQEVLLLTTVGRRSGERRTTPVHYERMKGKLVLVAANRGASHPPAWWLNLEAEPVVEVQVCDEASSGRARTAGPDERRELWPRLVEANRWLPKVQRRAGHELPLVVLEDLPDRGSTSGSVAVNGWKS